MKVDKNIPLPPVRNRKYLFLDKMEVGDSFFLDGGREDNIPILSTVFGRSRAGAWKFATRKLGSGIRVWRIV